MAVASGPNPTEDAERAERRLPWADEGQDGWLADDLLAVNGTEFIVTPDPDRYLDDQSTERRFLVAKTTAVVRRLELTIVELAPARIVELGIFKGGSAALLASLAAPAKLTGSTS